MSGILVRILVGFIGAAILAANSHVLIMEQGGYGETTAPLMIALAAGVAVAAIVVGLAWDSGRWALALLLVIALIAGEGFNFGITARHTIKTFEAEQAPLRAAIVKHEVAVQRVRDAEAALASIGPSSARLDAALKAKEDADAKVLASASDMGCRVNCKQLLEAQVNNAKAEIEAARSEIQDARRKAESVLSTARAEVEKTPAPVSADPFADRIGADSAKIDLVLAALRSVAINGLAALLLGFAAHTAKRAPKLAVNATHANHEPPRAQTLRAAEVADAVIEPQTVLAAPVQQIDDTRPVARVDIFALERTEASGSDARLDLAAVHTVYCDWAASLNCRALGRTEFETLFKTLCDAVGHQVERRGRKLYIKGLKLAA